MSSPAVLTSCCICFVYCIYIYARIQSQGFESISMAYLMLPTRHTIPQLRDVCMLDCRHSLHDLILGLCSLHHKQLSTGLKCCLGLVMQSAETRLRDMQTLVQQEAGVLLDRQRITIEGIPTPNPNHASALLSLACTVWCMLHRHLCIITVFHYCFARQWLPSHTACSS